jgi:hypothetical protein
MEKGYVGQFYIQTLFFLAWEYFFLWRLGFSLALGVGLGCCNGDKVGLIEKEIVIKN